MGCCSSARNTGEASPSRKQRPAESITPKHVNQIMPEAREERDVKGGVDDRGLGEPVRAVFSVDGSSGTSSQAGFGGKPPGLPPLSPRKSPSRSVVPQTMLALSPYQLATNVGAVFVSPRPPAAVQPSESGKKKVIVPHLRTLSDLGEGIHGQLTPNSQTDIANSNSARLHSLFKPADGSIETFEDVSIDTPVQTSISLPTPVLSPAVTNSAVFGLFHMFWYQSVKEGARLPTTELVAHVLTCNELLGPAFEQFCSVLCNCAPDVQQTVILACIRMVSLYVNGEASQKMQLEPHQATAVCQTTSHLLLSVLKRLGPEMDPVFKGSVRDAILSATQTRPLPRSRVNDDIFDVFSECALVCGHLSPENAADTATASPRVGSAHLITGASVTVDAVKIEAVTPASKQGPTTLVSHSGKDEVREALSSALNTVFSAPNDVLHTRLPGILHGLAVLFTPRPLRTQLGSICCNPVVPIPPQAGSCSVSVSLAGLSHPMRCLEERLILLSETVGVLSSLLRDLPTETCLQFLLSYPDLSRDNCAQCSAKRRTSSPVTVLVLLSVIAQCLKGSLAALAIRRKPGDSPHALLLGYLRELATLCGWLPLKGASQLVAPDCHGSMTCFVTLLGKLSDIFRRIHRVLPDSTVIHVLEDHASDLLHRQPSTSTRVTSGRSKPGTGTVSSGATDDRRSEGGSDTDATISDDEFDEDAAVLDFGATITAAGGVPVHRTASGRNGSSLWNRPITAQSGKLSELHHSSEDVLFSHFLSGFCVGVGSGLLSLAVGSDRPQMLSKSSKHHVKAPTVTPLQSVEQQDKFVRGLSAAMGAVTLLASRLLSGSLPLTEANQLRMSVLGLLDATLAIVPPSDVSGKSSGLDHMDATLSSPRGGGNSHSIGGGIRLPGLLSVVMLLHSQLCKKGSAGGPVISFAQSVPVRAFVRLLAASCESQESLTSLPPLLFDLLNLAPMDALVRSLTETPPNYRQLSGSTKAFDTPLHGYFRMISSYKLSMTETSVLLQRSVESLAHLEATSDGSSGSFAAPIYCSALPELLPVLLPTSGKLHPQILLAVCAVIDKSVGLLLTRKAPSLDVGAVNGALECIPVLLLALLLAFPDAPIDSSDALAVLKLSGSVSVWQSTSGLLNQLRLLRPKGGVVPQATLVSSICGCLLKLETVRQSHIAAGPSGKSSKPVEAHAASLLGGAALCLLSYEAFSISKIPTAMLDRGELPHQPDSQRVLELLSVLLLPGDPLTSSTARFQRALLQTEISIRATFSDRKPAEFSHWFTAITALTQTVCDLLEAGKCLRTVAVRGIALSHLLKLCDWAMERVGFTCPDHLRPDEWKLAHLMVLAINGQPVVPTKVTRDLRSDLSHARHELLLIPTPVSTDSDTAFTDIASSLRKSMVDVFNSSLKRIAACIPDSPSVGTPPWSSNAVQWAAVGLEPVTKRKLVWLQLLTKLLKLSREEGRLLQFELPFDCTGSLFSSSQLAHAVQVCHSVLSWHLLRGLGVDDSGASGLLSPRGAVGAELPLPSLRWNTVVELLNELHTAVACASDDDVTCSFYHPLLSGAVKAFPALVWRLAESNAAQNTATVGKKGTVRAIRVSADSEVDVSLADAVIRVHRFVELFTSAPIVFSIAIKAAVIRIAVTPRLYPAPGAAAATDTNFDRLLYCNAAVPPTIHVLDQHTVPIAAIADVEHVCVEVDRSTESVWKRCHQLCGPSVSSASLKLPWTVKFTGEPAVDERGVRKEFMARIADVFAGRLMRKLDDSDVWTFRRTAEVSDVSSFSVFGKCVAKAISFGDTMGLLLPRGLLSRLLGRHPNPQDLRTLDPDLHSRVRLFLDTPNVESVFFATFTVASADGSEVELCPGGATRAVTDSNKSEYVDLLIQYRFNKELERPIREMLHGLTAILPSQLLRAVTEDELLLLVAGEPQISAEDLRAHLRCGDGYTPSSPPVLLLLQCLANMSHAELSRFVQFVTGSPRLPPGGAAALDPPLTVQKAPNPKLLPSASTCFNLLKLPPYVNLDDLTAKLQTAVNEGLHSFGLL